MKKLNVNPWNSRSRSISFHALRQCICRESGGLKCNKNNLMGSVVLNGIKMPSSDFMLGMHRSIFIPLFRFADEPLQLNYSVSQSTKRHCERQ